MIKRTLIINIILLILIIKIPLRQVTVGEEIIEDKIISQDVEIEEPKITSRSLEEPRKIEEPIIEEVVEEDKTLEGYRVTSYYPGDNCATGAKTGSGKTTNDFSLININGKTAYSYQGRIVVAGATKELLKSGYNKNGAQNKQNKHYFNYYDTGRIKINNEWYGFIVLDSCGASMWEGQYRLDIFVPNSQNVIDTKNVEIVYD